MVEAIRAPAGGAGLGVLVEPGSYNCSNVGDIAMLQVAVQRLQSLWPGARLDVFTDDRSALLRHCPGVLPLDIGGRAIWVDDRYLLGRLHRWMPAAVSQRLVRTRRRLQRRAPGLTTATLGWRARLRGRSSGALDHFVDRWRDTDLVFIAGQASLADHAPEHAATILATLELAMESRIPTAMLGQGIGPLRDGELRSRARRILPLVDLIAVRDPRAGSELLADLGVDPARVIVTGDDAIELAARRRPPVLGDGLGVNLRVTDYTAVGQADVEVVRAAVQDFARHHGLALLPVPIALRRVGQDPRHIRELLRGYDDESDGGEGLDTPARVVEQVARCRILVTGAYHAAVFALALGVPAICLARSAYYVDKFLGLAELFGEGCEVILLDREDVGARLRAALHQTWAEADYRCAPLRLAADRQLAWSRAAYDRLAGLVAHATPDQARAERPSTSPAPPGRPARPAHHVRTGP